MSQLVALQNTKNFASALVPEKQQTQELSLVSQAVSTPLSYINATGKKITSFVLQYFDGMPSSSSKIYSSTIFPTYRLPKDFWETDAGKCILGLNKMLQERNILGTNNNEEVKSDLELRLYNESANTGEAFAHLFGMLGKDIDIKTATVALALIQKIVSAIHQRRDDKLLSLKSEMLDLERVVKDSFVKTLTLSKEYVFVENEEELVRIKEVEKKNFESMNQTREKVKAAVSLIKTQISLCDEALQDVNKVETALFHNEAISFDRVITIKDLETAQQTALLLAGSNETLAIRGISFDTKHIAQDVFSARIDSEKGQYQYFAPRIGTTKYNTKSDCKEALETFFKNNLSSKNTIELTIWKKKTVEEHKND